MNSLITASKNRTFTAEKENLKKAIEKGDRNAIRKIIEGGYPVDMPIYESGTTPLIYALTLSTYGKGDASADELLTLGADLSIPSGRGETPLHVAALNSPDGTRELIDKGANVNAVDDRGNTPLHWLMKHAKSVEKVLSTTQYLLDHGASLSIKNKDGDYPLTLAYKYGAAPDVKAELKKRGAPHTIGPNNLKRINNENAEKTTKGGSRRKTYRRKTHRGKTRRGKRSV